jgi:hypothetical protein
MQPPDDVWRQDVDLRQRHSETIPNSSGTTTYIWNPRNQLVGVNSPGVTATFVYSGLEKREEKTTDGNPPEFFEGVNSI